MRVCSHSAKFDGCPLSESDLEKLDQAYRRAVALDVARVFYMSVTRRRDAVEDLLRKELPVTDRQAYEKELAAANDIAALSLAGTPTVRAAGGGDGGEGQTVQFVRFHRKMTCLDASVRNSLCECTARLVVMGVLPCASWAWACACVCVCVCVRAVGVIHDLRRQYFEVLLPALVDKVIAGVGLLLQGHNKRLDDAAMGNPIGLAPARQNAKAAVTAAREWIALLTNRWLCRTSTTKITEAETPAWAQPHEERWSTAAKLTVAARQELQARCAAAVVATDAKK